MAQPIELVEAMKNTPKTGLWYSAGTDIPAEDFVSPDGEMVTFTSWDESVSDWKVITVKDGNIIGKFMMGLDK